MSGNVSVLVCLGDEEIEGGGSTLSFALADVALRADVRANELADRAQALRLTAARYRGASAAVAIAGVGVPASASHQNDNDEKGDEDGGSDNDFEVGEKG